MRALAQDGRKLREAITADRNRRVSTVTLAYRLPQTPPLEMIEFLGVETRTLSSRVTNSDFVQRLGKPVTMKIPLLKMSEPALTVQRPVAYWIPPAWNEVIERLALHGIQMETLTAPREVEVEMYRMTETTLAKQPFEGHVGVTGTPVVERHQRRFPAGSVRISTDQPLGELAVLLLEPNSTDSFYQWGFFLEIMTPTEYVEEYVMQPMAERMLAADAKLKTAFEQKLKADSTLAKNPQEKLQWLYRHTPFFDSEWNLYPVAREVK